MNRKGRMPAGPNLVGRELAAQVESLAASAEALAGRATLVKGRLGDNQASPAMRSQGEVLSNVTLAIRHMEDAQSRLARARTGIVT